MILFCEAFDKALLVFKDAALNIVGHADIYRSITFAGHDIDVIVLHVSQGLDSRIRGNDN